MFINNISSGSFYFSYTFSSLWGYILVSFYYIFLESFKYLIFSVFFMDKKFFKCTICDDVHYGIAGPEICPTCSNKDVYVEVSEKEAKGLMGI